MNVVNRKRKMEERRGDGEVKGRTRERERGCSLCSKSILLARV